MNQEPMWQVVPRELTPEMEAAMRAAQRDGEDFEGQYRAALAAHAKASAGRKPAKKASVSTQRGEELLEELQSGISSPAAGALFQSILTGGKKYALAIMRDERITDQDAQDLYVYLREKWLGTRLAVVEVPRTQVVEFIQETDAKAEQTKSGRPGYLLREGLNVVPCLPRFKGDTLTFLTNHDEYELKDVKQLWLVLPQV